MYIKKEKICVAILVLLLAPSLSLAHVFNGLSESAVGGVWVGDSIAIKSDGSVDPANAPIERNGNVYRLTKDVNSTSKRYGIYIGRSGIVLDGGGHTISGDIGYGVYILSAEDIKIRNLRVKGFSSGVGAAFGQRVEITNCVFETKGAGVLLSGFSNSVVAGNAFVNTGIDAQRAAKRGNVVRDNTVNGKPLIFLQDENGKTVRGVEAGQLVIVNSRNILVENIAVANTHAGVGIYDSENVTLKSSRIESSSYGVYVQNSGNVKIVENKLLNNVLGIYLHFSTSVLISGNDVLSRNQHIGIDLYGSPSNLIVGNLVEGYIYGIRLAGTQDRKSAGNRIYGNDFKCESNTYEVLGANTWDDGSKGNFWSDYRGVDSNGDGIGDTPYVVNSENVDRYPLMKPARKVEFSVSVSSAYGSVTGEGVYPAGSKVTLTVKNTVVDHGNGTRRVFRGWLVDGKAAGSESNFTFTVEKATVVTAVWDTEYLVKVVSEMGSVTGEGWYRAGATATVSVSPPSLEDSANKYTFEYFSLDGNPVSSSPTYTFKVDRPIVLSAHWRAEQKAVDSEKTFPARPGPGLLSTAAILLVVLAVIIVLAFLAARRRRR